MRLSVFGPGHPFRGGIASTTTSLVQALRARDHDVRFVVPLRQYPKWLYPGDGDRDPTACPKLDDSIAEFAPFEPWTWLRSRKRALARGDDLWILPFWTWAWAMWDRFLLAGRRRPPVIAVVHNPSDHEDGIFQRMVARSVLSRCDGLMTHADVLADHLRAVVPDVPVAAFPLPSPWTSPQAVGRREARQRLGVPEEARLALFVGLIRPYKGVDVLLDAMSRLPVGSPWRLIVAGEPWGGLGRTLPDRIVELSLRDRVDLRLGWLEESEVEDLLSASDLVVLPYRSGTQSAVAPRALAHGVPVLSTRVGGLGEVVEDGVNGRLVPPGSAREIRRVLEELTDDEQLQRLAEGARRTTDRLTWEGYAETLEGLMAEVRDRRK